MAAKSYAISFLRFFSVSLFIIFSQQSFAGNPKIDSLENLLRLAKADTVKIKLLNSIGNAYFSQNEAAAALVAYQKEAELERPLASENLKIKRMLATNLYYMGTVYLNQIGDYEKAIDHFIESFHLRESLGNDKETAYSLNGIGNVYKIQGNFDKALEYYFQCLGIRKEFFRKNKELQNSKEIGGSFNNIGNTYLSLRNYDKALAYYDSTLQIATKLTDKGTMGMCYHNMGLTYREKGQYEKAMECHVKTLALEKELGSEQGIGMSLMGIGQVHAERKEYPKAIAQLSEALEVIKRTGPREWEVALYHELSQLYNSTKDYASAYSFHQRYASLKDTLLNESSNKQITEMSTKYETEKKDKEILLLNKDKALKEVELEKQKAESSRQALQRNAVIAGLILVSLFSIIIYRGYRQKQKINKVIALQKAMVEEKNKDITDSINYAKKIQEALLPSESLKQKLFPDSFILFRPKDIVSGDFYWFAEKNGKQLIAAVDCTGHGVPGAFMSMIGNTFLNEIVNEKGITNAAEVLNCLRAQVISALKQGDGENKDGMDISLLVFDHAKHCVEFAGANNPLWMIRKGSLSEVKGDKQPIGSFRGETKPFTNHMIELQQGDTLYIFTDGYADQFGGEKGKKFKYKHLQETIISMYTEPMLKQELILSEKFNDWKSSLEQVDDVLVIGIKA